MASAVSVRLIPCGVISNARQNECYRQTNDDQQNNQPNRPVRDIKNWKYLRNAL